MKVDLKSWYATKSATSVRGNSKTVPTRKINFTEQFQREPLNNF